MKTQHDKNLDFLVEALACAHVHGLPTLKSTCLGFLEKHHCNLDTKATASLEKHPDLLMEMMRRFHRKVTEKKF